MRSVHTPFYGTLWHISPLRELRVVAIRPVGAGGPSLFTEVYAFRQTAARAPALERATEHFFAEFGARMAEIRGAYTATLVVAHRKGFPVRQFGGDASDFHVILLPPKHEVAFCDLMSTGQTGISVVIS